MPWLPQISGREPMRLVICVRNEGYEASLERHKVYRSLGRERTGGDSYLRIVDESGEDYLYPSGMFAAVSVPRRVAETIGNRS